MKKNSYTKLKEDFIQLKQELENIQDISNKKTPENAYIGNTIPVINTLYRINSDLTTFKNAITYAENIMFPNRTELYRLYKLAMADPHLSAAIQTRKGYTLSSEFIVADKDGIENEELTQLINTKWFYDFVNLSLDAQYFGFSLIQFIDRIDNEFKEIELVPRQYVKPEFGVVAKTPGQIDGTSYLEQPYSNWCIGVGEKTNLGLLAKSCPIVIWKQGAIASYAEYLEMNGVPLRVLKTDKNDPATRAMAENFLRNMSNSAYGIIGKDDEIEFVQARNTANAGDAFLGLIDKMDQQLSKLILGGTAIMDEKAHVGSADVQQKNFEMLCQGDRIYIENIFKYQLVPFLIKYHGFPLSGYKIVAKADDDLSLKESFEIDKALLPYYKIPASHFNEKYGCALEDVVTNPAPDHVVVPNMDPVDDETKSS
jgi:hypothetical protein